MALQGSLKVIYHDKEKWLVPFFFFLNNSFQWQQPIRQNMSVLVVTEAITFHQHFSADDSIFQQAICTWQMVLALSQSGALVSHCLSENCQVNTHWLKKQPPYTHPKQTPSTLSLWDPFCLYLEKLLSGFFCKWN